MDVDINKRVEQFVRLRDKINEIKDKHKEELKPYNEALAQLNDVLLGHLHTLQADKVGTPSGTVYRSHRNHASIADMSAFWTYVVTQGDFDMVDKKANPKRVEEYIDENGAPPPGINFTRENTVGVRRGSKK